MGERFGPKNGYLESAGSMANLRLRRISALLDAAEQEIDEYLEEGHGGGCACPFCTFKSDGLDWDEAECISFDLRGVLWAVTHGQAMIDGVTFRGRQQWTVTVSDSSEQEAEADAPALVASK